MKRLYLSSRSKHLPTDTDGALAFKYLMTMEKFLDVSKVLLNKFVDFQQLLKEEFLTLLGKQKSSLRSKLDKSESAFAAETF